MLDLAILGLLHESPMHGYELRKQLAHQAGCVPCRDLLRLALPDPSPAADRRLDHRRAGRRLRTDPEVPPLTSRRGRVVYKITAEGKERFQALLGPSRSRKHMKTTVSACTSRFSRAPTRPPACGSWKVAAARSKSDERACATRSSRAAERLDAYTLELQRHGLDACEREVRWLEELIATERSGRHPGNRPNRLQTGRSDTNRRSTDRAEPK